MKSVKAERDFSPFHSKMHALLYLLLTVLVQWCEIIVIVLIVNVYWYLSQEWDKKMYHMYLIN